MFCALPKSLFESSLAGSTAWTGLLPGETGRVGMWDNGAFTGAVCLTGEVVLGDEQSNVERGKQKKHNRLGEAWGRQGSSWIYHCS